MGKYTPGPWARYDNGGETEDGFVYGSGYATTIWGPKGPGYGAIAKFGYTPNEESIANAQLCSAAPEMLEALKEALEALERADDYGVPGLGRIIDAAYAAIRKAEGEE